MRMTFCLVICFMTFPLLLPSCCHMMGIGWTPLTVGDRVLGGVGVALLLGFYALMLKIGRDDFESDEEKPPAE